jgi:MFS family permease
MGLQKSIHLKGDNYQWLSSIFYIGYLFWEYPTNRLLQRLPLAKWSGFNVIMWGLTLCCMAAVKNFAGAVAVRFFLGVFESAVTPGFALFTSQWYTKKEQGTRTGIWFSFNGFAQIFGGFVAYGISVGVKKHGAAIESWKIVFLTIGLITAAVGCIFLWLMPDNQLNAWFLTPQERIMAVERIRKNQQGVGNKHFKMYQLKEALLDPMTWAFVFYALVADIPNGQSILSLLMYSANIRRWNYQLLLPTHRLFWIHPGSVSPIRHPRRRHRSCSTHCCRIPRRQIRMSTHHRSSRDVRRHSRDAPYRLSPNIQQHRPPHRILPNSSLSHRLCCTSLPPL